MKEGGQPAKAECVSATHTQFPELAQVFNAKHEVREIDVVV